MVVYTQCLSGHRNIIADVVELADTMDLGSIANRCAGSSPVIRTIKRDVYFNIGISFNIIRVTRQDLLR